MPLCDGFKPTSCKGCVSESSSSIQAILSTKQRENDRARGSLLSWRGLPFKAQEVGPSFLFALSNKRVSLEDWAYCSQAYPHMEQLHHLHLARDEEGIPVCYTSCFININYPFFCMTFHIRILLGSFLFFDLFSTPLMWQWFRPSVTNMT